MEDQVYDLLLKENEVTWQDIIHNLIKTEQMDPWDVDITKLTHKYIETVKLMKEMNYFISGKVLLASALLLKIKSQRLIDEDISNFDSFLFHSESAEFEELGEFVPYHQHKVDIPQLGVRTPQARKRRVSITDLISALEKALHVDNRRKLRLQKFFNFNKPEIPERKVDITLLIDQIYHRLEEMFSKKNNLVRFSELKTSGKQETILTLLPLLHLHNSKHINLEQECAFDDIHIHKFI